MKDIQFQLELDVQEPYLSFIKNGQKTVEGRLAKPKYLKLKKGDLININGVPVTVLKITKYSSFQEMILTEGIKNVIPDAVDIATAVKAYYQFYTPADEKKYQVVGISIQLKNETK